jgi:hypothetical protein
VAFLADAAARLDGPASTAWRRCIDDLYGDLSGQRGLDRDPDVQRFLAGRPHVSLPDLIVALQTYYALLCDALAVGCQELTGLAAGRFLRALRDLATGETHRRLGVTPADNPLPLDWYLDCVSSKDLPLFQQTIADLVDVCEALKERSPSVDLPRRIHAALMPRNLLHIMGEFYTPPWLARLLLEDAGWEPGQSLVDPFAGSGAFLLAAIDHARRQGCACRDVLPKLCAIDRNPAAFVALRANLLLALGRGAAGARLPIRCADSLLLDAAASADVLVTNPPWVGWEYIPRPYRERLAPAWKQYGLFTARGRDAAFLKEDLSTLALVVAWDRYLKVGGASAVLLRPAAMRSHLAARGLRRLSLHADSAPLALRLVREFDGLRPFAGADAPAAVWRVDKGEPTTFPVAVLQWRFTGRQRPGACDSLAQVRGGVAEVRLAAERTDPGDLGSPWVIGDPQCLQISAALRGSNPYKVRTGVFTGGANAVYYLQRADGASRYRNGAAGAKRDAPRVECELEDDLVYEVVRGRDLSFWNANAGSLLLCPHTALTRMHPISPAVMRRRFPRVAAYLQMMRPALDARRGFSGWEQTIQEKTYYAMQRVGEYTFAPYKAAWRYIADDFIVAVIGPDAAGRPRLCNDKVMYLAFDYETEAYFVCGMLSSDPVRWRVVSTMTGTQISTSALRGVSLPAFCRDDPVHADIAQCCRAGHEAVRAGRHDAAAEAVTAINRMVGRLYGLAASQLAALREDLLRRPRSRGRSAAE